MENPMIVAYSPNDFFWQSIDKSSDPNINNFSCSNLPVGLTCPTIDNSLNCLNIAYCQNKNYSQLIANQQSTHSAADGRFSDTKSDYFAKLQTTINLGIGIVGVGTFIYFNNI